MMFPTFSDALNWARKGNARDNCHFHQMWRVVPHIVEASARYRVAVFNKTDGTFSHFAN